MDPFVRFSFLFCKWNPIDDCWIFLLLFSVFYFPNREFTIRTRKLVCWKHNKNDLFMWNILKRWSRSYFSITIPQRFDTHSWGQMTENVTKNWGQMEAKRRPNRRSILSQWILGQFFFSRKIHNKFSSHSPFSFVKSVISDIFVRLLVKHWNCEK